MAAGKLRVERKHYWDLPLNRQSTVPMAWDFGVVRSSSEPGEHTVKPQLDCCWRGEGMSHGGAGNGSFRLSRRLEEDCFTCGIAIVTLMPSVLSLTRCVQAAASAICHVSALEAPVFPPLRELVLLVGGLGDRKLT